MSEMTATRIGLATLTVVWVVAALLLWRTEVPSNFDVRPSLTHFAATIDLERNEHHDAVLRALALGSLAMQLVGLALFAWRPPPLRGPPLVRAAALGALAALVLFAARLPFGVATHWWQRRYEIAQLGYGQWLLDRIGPLAARAALLAFAAAFCLWLAGRVGRRWWVVASPVFVLVGVSVILAQPLLSPRLEPVRDRALVAEVERLAARQGLDRPEVEFRRTHGRTRQISAEAIGIGSTTRVVLWETALDLPPRERRFLIAHELAHVSRAHLWKGLGWFALLLVPGLAVLAVAVPLREARDVARAVLVAFTLLLAAEPVANAVSRRYEAEADFVAVRTTTDPYAMYPLMRRIAEAGVRDPDPPAWWHVVFGTHPTLAERVGMAIRFHAGPPRGGS